ncbi:hypothetical protein Patl_3896 [Paraglaciecola sp. T6c]|nr:hypothetical protein Patl_3896 [Paraglaciecola sp. T6c]
MGPPIDNQCELVDNACEKIESYLLRDRVRLLVSILCSLKWKEIKRTLSNEVVNNPHIAATPADVKPKSNNSFHLTIKAFDK